MRAAQDGGALIAFDVGPRASALTRDVPLGGAAALRELLRISDLLLLTQDEAGIVTGLTEAEAAAGALLQASAAAHPWVVVKRGKEGALALTRHVSERRVYLPAITVDALDTVGCGDSFAAAVVLGRTRGHPLAATLALANAVGAATATGRGAGRNVARLPHVRQLLEALAANEQAPEHARVAARAAMAFMLQPTL